MASERDNARRGVDAATNATKANLDLTDDGIPTSTTGGPATSGRRPSHSIMNSIKEALRPGDIRAAEKRRAADPDEGPISRKLESMMPGSAAHEESGQGKGGHLKPGMLESLMSKPDHHAGRNRSSGFLDHLMGRSRSQDDASGIIGFRSERESLRRNSGSDDGTDENYRFGMYSTEKTRGRRGSKSSNDVPRISAFDTQGPLGHQYSSEGGVEGAGEKGRTGSITQSKE